VHRDKRPRRPKGPHVPYHKKTKQEKAADNAEYEVEKHDRETALEAMKKEVKKRVAEVGNVQPHNQLCANERDGLLRTMYWM
jgi:hypothetical protein